MQYVQGNQDIQADQSVQVVLEVVLSGVGCGHLLTTTLPLSHCLEAAVPVEKLKHHDHIHWLVQIMIIFID